MKEVTVFQGDSGGPLVCSGQQFGVVSHIARDYSECFKEPVLIASIPHNIGWINEILGNAPHEDFRRSSSFAATYKYELLLLSSLLH